MKFRSTWALFALTLAFGAYIYFFEIKKAAQDEVIKAEREKIFSIESSKIKAVQIKNSNGSFDLEKDAKGVWQIKAPLADAADEQVLSSMLTSISSEKFDEVVSEGDTDLKTFGLDSPKDSVTLTTDDGTTKKLDIGIDGALPGKIYVRREGEKQVLFASSTLKAQLEKSLREFRDKRIFKGTKSNIGIIELNFYRKDNPLGIKLLRQKNNKWTLVKPFESPTDTEAINSFLNQIEGLRAADFVSELSKDPKILAQYNLSHPETEMIFSDEANKPLARLSIGSSKEGKVFIKVEGVSTIYQVAASSMEPLNKKPDDFRDKRGPFEFNKNEVGEIIYKTSLVDLDLTLKPTGWELVRPQGKKIVNQVQVSNLLQKLNMFKINEFLKNESPKALLPPSGPKGSLTLKDSKGTLLIQYNWGEKTRSGKSYYVRTSKGSETYGLESSLIDSLPGQTLLDDSKSK